jgi:hypothetical protein
MYCAPDKVDEKGEVLGEKDSKSRSHAGDRGGSAVTGGSAIGDAEDKLEMAAQRARTRAAAGCDAPVEESCEGLLVFYIFSCAEACRIFFTVCFSLFSSLITSVIYQCYPKEDLCSCCFSFFSSVISSNIVYIAFDL